MPRGRAGRGGRNGAVARRRAQGSCQTAPTAVAAEAVAEVRWEQPWRGSVLPAVRRPTWTRTTACPSTARCSAPTCCGERGSPGQGRAARPGSSPQRPRAGAGRSGPESLAASRPPGAGAGAWALQAAPLPGGEVRPSPATPHQRLPLGSFPAAAAPRPEAGSLRPLRLPRLLWVRRVGCSPRGLCAPGLGLNCFASLPFPS